MYVNHYLEWIIARDRRRNLLRQVRQERLARLARAGRESSGKAGRRAKIDTKNGQRYDLILDNVGNYSLSDLRPMLTPTGILQPNGGGHSNNRWIGPMGSVIKANVLSLFLRQQGGTFLATNNKGDRQFLKELIEAGKVTPVIDRTYSLSETPEAIGYVGEGHARGKVVIAVERKCK
jgi:NADPH:quinone reductase-like Zn-dependent oxidoreductase